ncbi:MAG: transglutaminase family protein, partial [Verrucomicrobia bacterium]|nr:transglutaminase family protein [Verrucomicrobiota bacterium]
VLEEIEGQQSLEDFTLLCHLFPDHGDIEHACWLLTRVLNPGVEIAPYQRQLDDWGCELAQRLQGIETPRARVLVTAHFLAGDLGFHGNAEHYYDVGNSLLSNVLTTRLGIPITLAVIYIIVAARAGLKLEGINLPGHFIVRHAGIFFDPFHRGKILLPADCEAILRKQKLAFQASYLEAANARMILTRILANLLYIFQDAGDETQHGRISDWLKALERK